MLTDILAKSGEAAKSGPIGLAVILILCIVCYFLFKSMSKHLRTVRENFPRGEFPDGTDDGASGRSESIALDKPRAEGSAGDEPPDPTA
jgi:hypothetical protein